MREELYSVYVVCGIVSIKKLFKCGIVKWYNCTTARERLETLPLLCYISKVTAGCTQPILLPSTAFIIIIIIIIIGIS